MDFERGMKRERRMGRGRNRADDLEKGKEGVIFLRKWKGECTRKMERRGRWKNREVEGVLTGVEGKREE